MIDMLMDAAIEEKRKARYYRELIRKEAEEGNLQAEREYKKWDYRLRLMNLALLQMYHEYNKRDPYLGD